MIYILLDENPTQTLTIKGDVFKYLIKVRRHVLGDTISFRSKENLSFLYEYEIIEIDNRSVSLQRKSFIEKIVKAEKNLHIAWCIIDIKSIEKVLPTLNEIGVLKISFIHCDRSQKNFKLDFKRFQRILEASMQQCGRSTYIEFDEYKNVQLFLEEFPDTKIFDFSERTCKDFSDIKTVLVGCEGGFSKNERLFMEEKNTFKLDTQNVLRSESAVVALASKIIL